MLPVATLPTPGGGCRCKASRRGVLVKYKREHVCKRDRARVRGERAGHRCLVAGPFEGHTEGALLETRPTGRERDGLLGDTLRYLYLPRLKDPDVLAKAIRTGAASRDFFGTAYGEHDGKFEGFQFGHEKNLQIDATLLLIDPEAAALYEEAESKKTKVTLQEVSEVTQKELIGITGRGPDLSGAAPAIDPREIISRSFHCTAEIAPATAKMRLVQIADEIVSVLGSGPNASVKVVVEVSADFPGGVKDSVKRAVSENARFLGLKNADWE